MSVPSVRPPGLSTGVGVHSDLERSLSDQHTTKLPYRQSPGKLLTFRPNERCSNFLFDQAEKRRRTFDLSFWPSLPADIVPDGDTLGRPLLLEGGVGVYHVLLDPLPLQADHGVTIQIYSFFYLQESGRSWQIGPCSLWDTRQRGRFYWKWRALQWEGSPLVLEERTIRISRLCWEITACEDSRWYSETVYWLFGNVGHVVDGLKLLVGYLCLYRMSRDTERAGL